MWNRELRKRDVVTLLEEADFYVDEEALEPVAFEVLVEGLELLHPEDVRALDRALHEYVNGEYYLVLYIIL